MRSTSCWWRAGRSIQALVEADPHIILESLRSQPTQRLSGLPASSGLYALWDHSGVMRYIGIAHSEGFRTRILSKHRTGSEEKSHKFSAAYNSGRLWRDRHDKSCMADAQVSKRLRNEFILQHCSATVFPIGNYDGKSYLESVERKVISIARSDETTWNRKFEACKEPNGLVDNLVAELRLGPNEIAAINRQDQRYRDLRQ